jgi:hypothetical protein
MAWTRKSYDAVFRWSNPAERASARKALLSDGLTDEVARLDAAKNMGDWYRITQEAAAAVPQSVIDSSAKQAEKELNAAAAALGRKGGMAKSKAKAAASRANGALGGRPKNPVNARSSSPKK